METRSRNIRCRSEEATARPNPVEDLRRELRESIRVTRQELRAEIVEANRHLETRIGQALRDEILQSHRTIEARLAETSRQNLDGIKQLLQDFNPKGHVPHSLPRQAFNSAMPAAPSSLPNPSSDNLSSGTVPSTSGSAPLISGINSTTSGVNNDVNNAANGSVNNFASSEEAVSRQNTHILPTQPPIVSRSTGPINPDIFDGSSPLDSYLCQFEIAAEHNNWSNEVKASFLSTSLRGKARIVLDKLSKKDLKDYDKIKSVLESRFGESKFARTYFNQLQTRKQRKDEDFQSFADDLERLARFAYTECSEEIRDKLASLQFISGIYSQKIQVSLRSERIESLSLIVNRAMELDSIHKLVYGNSNQNFERNNLNKTNVNEKNFDNEKDQKENAKPDYMSNPAACWNCGKLGHINKNCRLPRRNLQTSSVSND